MMYFDDQLLTDEEQKDVDEKLKARSMNLNDFNRIEYINADVHQLWDILYLSPETMTPLWRHSHGCVQDLVSSLSKAYPDISYESWVISEVWRQWPPMREILTLSIRGRQHQGATYAFKLVSQGSQTFYTRLESIQYKKKDDR